MTTTIISTTTQVPIADDTDVEIAPGDPYPAPYRGSRYSIVDSKQHHQVVLRWKYNDLVVMIDPPEGLLSRLQEYGKSDDHGRGSIRITADGEILSKIHSDNYSNTDKAPISNGWIPVYVGRLDGDLGFDIEINPSKPHREADIWNGFCFNHGERWSVGVNDSLIWTWQDYRFKSAFDHPDLISTYQQYRSTPGRIYINEFKQVFINVPRGQVPESKKEAVTKIYTDWQRRAEQNGNTAAQRLVSRRLKVTGDGDPEEGHLPLHIGHLSEFDDGLIPRPVVTDETYFVKAARGEETHG